MTQTNASSLLYFLFLAETRTQITEMLANGTSRLKIAKIYDSSISSQEESDVEIEMAGAETRFGRCP